MRTEQPWDASAVDLTLSKYDGVRLPFRDKSFDLVYASHVLEHVTEPRKILAEMSRVTRDVIYVEVPCELHLRTTHTALQRSLDIGHINAYTPESFSVLLQTSALDVVALQLFDHTLDVHSFYSSRFRGVLKLAIRQCILKIDSRIASRIFTYHCGAIVRPTAGSIDSR